MTFSKATLTASYSLADGSVPDGEVDLALAQTLTNGDVSLAGGYSATVPIDASGNVGPVTLAATTDADTFPDGGTYRVTERLDGATPVTWFTPMPSGAVDLADLRPQQTAWG